ncbi:MAG: hypothetical protein J6Q48_09710 [Bacteroidaceae bacterium]|nr:hypothetical protein [Bacteroidaceae bacterium]
MLDLTNNELSLIMQALDDEATTLEEALKDLTEPDERYEHNDVQNQLLATHQLYNKIKEARDAKNRIKK